MKFIVAVVLSFCFMCATFAQEIVFQPEFGNEALQLGQYYKMPSGDSLQVSAFRFYISGIEFLKDGKTVWKEADSYHLVDMENPASLKIAVTVPISYNQIAFNLGIDSLTNVSGAMGGDLDPSLGMYWTWQSGYINFKLEGKSNLCQTRNHEFQFHLGGYLSPNTSLQHTALNLPAASPKKITVAVDLEKWHGFKNLPDLNQVMSPSQDAVFLSESAVRLFKIN